MKVKICGITNIADAEAAISYGADFLGFIFAKTSPRFIEPDQIKRIIARLPSSIRTVGVFTEGTAEEIRNAISHCGLSLIQFHGHFPRAVITAFAEQAIQVIVTKDASLLIPSLFAYMLDKNNGGAGWEMADKVKPFGNIILAGGLTPENVQEAIAKVSPYGVDVCSSVEKEKGKKDHVKLKRFIEAAKGGRPLDVIGR
ncbi:MAG: phosphoribosylanthranilate isomerase [Nitrospirota bacterium]